MPGKQDRRKSFCAYCGHKLQAHMHEDDATDHSCQVPGCDCQDYGDGVA